MLFNVLSVMLFMIVDTTRCLPENVPEVTFSTHSIQVEVIR